MRIVYMVPGFFSTDAIILNKFVEYSLDTHVVYTRPVPADYEVLKKVNAYWINLNRFNYLPKLLRWVLFASEAISKIRKLKPDVILAQGIQVHGLLSILSGVRPILLMPWGSDWAIDAHKNIFMRLVSRYVVNHADLVQIDCEIGKTCILRLSAGKVKAENVWVFPQGIELDIFKPKPERRMALRNGLGWSDKKVLIMTRQLKPVYGIDIFLQALARIAKEAEDVRALIVGEGPLEQELKQLAASLGLSETVRFTGRVERTDLVNYLNAADIYVSTSHSDGTSLSLLEAMAVGLPVVVTDVPANIEWVKDGYNGFVATRGSPQSVSEALLKLLKSPELYHVFGTRNVDLARDRADWDKNFDKFMTMFRMLVQRQNGLTTSVDLGKNSNTMNSGSPAG